MKKLNIQVHHPTLDKVTLIRVLPPTGVPEQNHNVEPCWLTENLTTDDLYFRKALVSDDDGKVSVVPLRDLLFNGRSLLQQVLEHEAIERFKAQKPTTGERYLHSHYGEVELITRYSDQAWLCRILSGADVISETKYAVDVEKYSARRRLPTHCLKEFICHPSELLPKANIKKLEPKDEYLYVAYSDMAAVAEMQTVYRVKRDKSNAKARSRPSATRTQVSRRDDFTVKGIDEFLTILADLPRVVKTRKIDGKVVQFRETPRVLARGETTGRLYVTPAYWLWRVTGESQQSPFKADGMHDNGKVAERYRWQDPRNGDAPAPPAWFSYDPESEDPHYNGFLLELPEAIPDGSPPHVNLRKRDAWYWKLPPRQAREFFISRITINWTKQPLRVGSSVAILTVTYRGKDYCVPITLAFNNELSVRVRSREIAAYLCRYTISKMEA